ncbi:MULTISPECIES: GAF and ANTAR domain-containing protein [unclassified Diaminobutyricimonas]|uniref:ANTAR domain-containing protein n=1 Tax=unclassified Diaminobutyricimonas TaxID=2643261 RepID=UPI0012F4F08C|nr:MULTISPECIES: GAF and ANTAR domain-containing protein [unclassified Diaminobutyricimonas]
MAGETRESRLVEAFVGLADALVLGYDIVDLLHSLVERVADLLEATDAGILVADGDGEPGVIIASTREDAQLIDLLQMPAGPGAEARATGEPIAVDDLTRVDARWRDFATGAAALGYGAAHAVPLRLRENVLGSLTVFRADPGFLSDQDATLAQALADVASISIVHERALRAGDVVREQLQHALNSRVIIEQAKGVLAHTEHVSMDEAFRQIRVHARNSGQPLSEVARSIVARAQQG